MFLKFQIERLSLQLHKVPDLNMLDNPFPLSNVLVVLMNLVEELLAVIKNLQLINTIFNVLVKKCQLLVLRFHITNEFFKLG